LSLGPARAAWFNRAADPESRPPAPPRFMLFTSAGPTPYDLRFSLVGVPIRISPAFWIVAALLGGGQSLEGALIWVAAVLVSILVHEMGHALVQRAFGGRPEIVLYALGGYAAAPGVRDSPGRNLLVYAAGPAAGFALYGLFRALAAAGMAGDDPRVRYFFGAMLYINLIWSLLNLAPIWPLDGGRIAREVATLVLRPATGIVVSLGLSVVAAAALAVYAYQATGSLWNTALFALLGYESYRALERYRASRGAD